MTCKMCRRTQKDGFRKSCGGIDDVKVCPHGDVKFLSHANRRFAELFNRSLPMLFDGFGGINPTALQLAWDTYQVPEGVRPVFFDKAMTVIAAIKEIQAVLRQKREHGNTA